MDRGTDRAYGPGGTSWSKPTDRRTFLKCAGLAGAVSLASPLPPAPPRDGRAEIGNLMECFQF